METEEEKEENGEEIGMNRSREGLHRRLAGALARNFQLDRVSRGRRREEEEEERKRGKKITPNPIFHPF